MNNSTIDNKIAELNSIIDMYRRRDEIRQLELQFKMSDNYKLEIERDIKLKDLENRRMEAETKLLQVKLKLERSRNKS